MRTSMSTLRPVPLPTEPVKGAREVLERLEKHLGKVVLGKPKETRLALTCLCAKGHLLLEDVPGVGKTTLAEGLARSFSLTFARIQFTADLLPSDIVGAQIFNASRGAFELRPGPIFHQVVLADELNRAPPRTQSALLEAMGQGQVSLDGVTHPLPQPFSVIATQNPIDLSGTYPLPDSQLDRFLLRLSLGHLTPELEAELVRTRRGEVVGSLTPVASAAELLSLQAQADRVQVEESLAQYAVAIAAATRAHAEIERGASTRAVLSLMSAARAWALWEDRDFVTPGDLRAVLAPALTHRLLLKSAVQGTYSRDEAAHLLEEILRKVPAPR